MTLFTVAASRSLNCSFILNKERKKTVGQVKKVQGLTSPGPSGAGWLELSSGFSAGAAHPQPPGPPPPAGYSPPQNRCSGAAEKESKKKRGSQNGRLITSQLAQGGVCMCMCLCVRVSYLPTVGAKAIGGEGFAPHQHGVFSHAVGRLKQGLHTEGNRLHALTVPVPLKKGAVQRWDDQLVAKHLPNTCRTGQQNRGDEPLTRRFTLN